MTWPNSKPSWSSGQHQSQTLLFSHPLMGVLAIATLTVKVLVDTRVLTGYNAMVYPIFVLLLGLQLFFYTE